MNSCHVLDKSKNPSRGVRRRRRSTMRGACGRDQKPRWPTESTGCMCTVFATQTVGRKKQLSACYQYNRRATQVLCAAQAASQCSSTWRCCDADTAWLDEIKGQYSKGAAVILYAACRRGMFSRSFVAQFLIHIKGENV